MRLLAANEKEALYGVAAGTEPGRFDAVRFVGDLLSVKTADNLAAFLLSDSMRAFALGLMQDADGSDRFPEAFWPVGGRPLYQKGSMGSAADRRNFEYLDAMFDRSPFRDCDLVWVPFGVLSAMKDFASAVVSLACLAQGRRGGGRHAEPIRFEGVEVSDGEPRWVRRGGKTIAEGHGKIAELRSSLSGWVKGAIAPFVKGESYAMQTGEGVIDFDGEFLFEETFRAGAVALIAVDEESREDGCGESFDRLMRFSDEVDGYAIEERYCSEIVCIVVRELLALSGQMAHIGEGGRIVLSGCGGLPVWRDFFLAIVEVVASDRIGLCSVCGAPFVSKSPAGISRRDTCSDACRQKKRAERKAARDGNA